MVMQIKKPNFKPEFGNNEQINQLKEYQKKKEALENSNRYKVRMKIRSSNTFVVEAESKEEAKDKAYDEYFQSLIDFADLDTKIIGKAMPKENNNINNKNIINLFKEEK